MLIARISEKPRNLPSEVNVGVGERWKEEHNGREEKLLCRTGLVLPGRCSAPVWSELPAHTDCKVL